MRRRASLAAQAAQPLAPPPPPLSPPPPAGATYRDDPGLGVSPAYAAAPLAAGGAVQPRRALDFQQFASQPGEDDAGASPVRHVTHSQNDAVQVVHSRR